MDGVDATLLLAGRFAGDALRAEVSTYPGWRKVNELGYLGRKQVTDVLAQSFAGLVVFNRVPNFVHAQPIKMFEYMAAGVPVIASNFPLWKEFVEGNQCGICVDADDPGQIAAAITHLQRHPEEVARMGRNGYEAVKRVYRWDHEEVKLVSMYRNVLAA
jgi:glycosyltransferase involved in cell wall biosynthesis